MSHLPESIWAACESGNISSITKLLHEFDGATLSFEVNNGLNEQNMSSPLMIAADNGHALAVELLIHAGVDIDFQSSMNGWTALMFACRNGHAEVVQVLVAAGADLELSEKDGWTALLLAAGNGHSHVVQTLLDAGANINALNQEEGTALMEAAEEGHEATVHLLLRNDAAVLLRDTYGRTAADRAQTEAIRAIINAYGHASTEDAFGMSTPDQDEADPLSTTAKVLAQAEGSTPIPAASAMVALVESEQESRGRLMEQLSRVTALLGAQIKISRDLTQRLATSEENRAKLELRAQWWQGNALQTMSSSECAELEVALLAALQRVQAHKGNYSSGQSEKVMPDSG